MTANIFDHLWQLEIARIFGSRQTRKPDGRQHACTICNEPVPVIEDQIPRLGSGGTVLSWKTRVAHAHRRECWRAHEHQVAAEHAANPTPDLWDPDATRSA